MAVDVAEWLRNLGLERYVSVFQENDVNADVLCHLTAEDLKELGVATVGHRRQLLRAVAELRDDAATLQVATHNTPRSTSAVERRHITVLFCDIVGSTSLSIGLDPEELREILTIYQASVGAAVAGEQGYIARFVGDGVLAYFGWPNPDEAHAESAVRAGLAIIDAVGKQQLSVRIGIATGLVITGDLVGVGAAQTMTAIGETPNLAARLQALAQPDTIVVSEATRIQIGQMFELEDLGLRTLKGFDTPVRPWRVVRQTAVVSRSEGVYVSPLTQLVGRDEELDLLLRRWRESKGGEGRIVLLSGEAGIGKSRLLAALEEHLTDDPRVSLRYFCSPHHQDSALYPVIARLEREAGFTRSDTAADRLAKLEAVLAPTGPPAEDVALLAALMSIPTAGHYPVLELGAQQRKVRTFNALLRRLSGLAHRQPVLLLFEDAHWSDPTSLELLDAVIEQAPSLALLVIVSFRPEFIAPWFGYPRVSLMALSRLDRKDATTLAAHIVQNHALASPLLDRIVVQSDGVPLFIEELTRAVLEAPERDAATLGVPDTLQASLMARLDRLPAAKMVAQVGSVIGREFPHTLLAAARRLEDSQLAEGLNELAAAGLVFRRGVPPDAVYMFKHALVRDVVYASLPRIPRQQLHREIGQALCELLPERARIEPEVIAYHFAQAGLKEAAVEWWGKAGDLALQRSANVEAVAHLKKALELCQEVGDLPEQRLRHLRLQIIYGNALRTVQGFIAPETKAAFERARDIAATISDAPERFSADYGLWSGHFLAGDLSAMRELASEFLHNVEGDPSLPETGIAHRMCGMTSWFSGDFADARQHLEHALACYDDKRDYLLAFRFGQDLAVPVMAYLGFTLWSLGVGEDAHGFLKKAVCHALATKHIPTIAYAYLHASLFEMMRRNWRGSDPHLRAYLELAREHVMPMWLAYGAFHEGWLQWHGGDHHAGTAQMHEGLRLMREAGMSTFAPLYELILAETEAAAGYISTAIASVDAQLLSMRRTGQCWFLSEAQRVRGEFLLRSKPADIEAAESAFIESIKIARGQSAKRFEFRAAKRLAQLWSNQAKRVEHRGVLAILADGIADRSEFDGFPEGGLPAGDQTGH